MSVDHQAGEDPPPADEADRAAVLDRYDTKTGLTFDVPAGGSNPANFALEAAKKMGGKRP